MTHEHRQQRDEGQRVAAGWRQAKSGVIGNICNSVNNEKKNTNKNIETKICKCFQVFRGLISLVTLTMTMKEGIR